jgi:hypothetical protein
VVVVTTDFTNKHNLHGRQPDVTDNNFKDDNSYDMDNNGTSSPAILVAGRNQRVDTRAKMKRLREQDSDDNVTEGEDIFDVDDQENFWQERELLWKDMLKHQDEYDTASDDSDVEYDKDDNHNTMVETPAS